MTRVSRSDISGTWILCRLDDHSHALLCGPLVDRDLWTALRRRGRVLFLRRSTVHMPMPAPTTHICVAFGGVLHSFQVCASTTRRCHRPTAFANQRQRSSHLHLPGPRTLHTTCSSSPLDSQSTSGPWLTPRPALIRPAPQVDVDDEKPLHSKLARCSLVEDGLQKPAGSPVCLSVYVRDMVTSLLTFSLASAYGSGLRAG